MKYEKGKNYPGSKGEPYWMIEYAINGQAHWWNGIYRSEDPDALAWTTDPFKAERFRTSDEAERIGKTIRREFVITEHLDMYPTPTGADTKEEGGKE